MGIGCTGNALSKTGRPSCNIFLKIVAYILFVVKSAFLDLKPMILAIVPL